LKDKILLESEFICQYCQEQKTKVELVVDHFIPIDKGGDNSDENLVCSCIRCNGHKTNTLPDIFLEKPYPFLNPSEKINSLLGAYKKLKGASKELEGAKVIVKVKDKVKAKDKEIEGENSKKSKRQPPPYDEFLLFALENKPDVNRETLKLKYESWKANDWQTGKDKPIKNWKSTILNTLPYLGTINKSEPMKGVEGAVEMFNSLKR
jgi:hypothetical protein